MRARGSPARRPNTKAQRMAPFEAAVGGGERGAAGYFPPRNFSLAQIERGFQTKKIIFINSKMIFQDIYG